MSTFKPQITVSILSWLLEDRLIKTLHDLPRSTSIPLNLCLHVQGSEQISREKQLEIRNAASNFIHKDIYFTSGNKGAAVPRANLLARSTNTPFIFVTDNDMEFQEGSIDVLYNFLTNLENSSYGIVNLVDNTLNWHRRVDSLHKRITYFPVSLNPPRVVNIDLCGASCSLIRSEIVKESNIIDLNYHIGTWDIDLCMNVRKLGWKLATICDKKYLAHNDTSYRTAEYNKIKSLTPIRKKGINRFWRKWGITPEIEHQVARLSTSDPADTAIITRAIYNTLGNHRGIGILTKTRIKSMQNFFINSLKAQTDKDFTLHIFTGPENNEATKVIKSLDWSGLNTNFIHINESMLNWQESSNKSGNWGREKDSGCPEDIIRKVGHPLHTIMARLDNDDWVAPGWVTHMKHMSNIIDEAHFLINYQVIGQAPDGRLYNFFMKHGPLHTSPFLAVVQKDSPRISPYADIHLSMGKLFDSVYTIQPSYVFMVIGNDNRSNRVYRQDRYFEDIAIEKLKSQLESKLRPKIQRTGWQARIAQAQVNR